MALNKKPVDIERIEKAIRILYTQNEQFDLHKLHFSFVVKTLNISYSAFFRIRKMIPFHDEEERISYDEDTGFYFIKAKVNLVKA